jgi:hypothetical protein
VSGATDYSERRVQMAKTKDKRAERNKESSKIRELKKLSIFSHKMCYPIVTKGW